MIRIILILYFINSCTVKGFELATKALLSGEVLDSRYSVFGYTGQGVFSNVVRYVSGAFGFPPGYLLSSRSGTIRI